MPSTSSARNFNALYSIASIRRIENAARIANPLTSLMQAAGQAASEFAQTLISNSAAHVLILAGSGDNGGDAFEVGHHLAQSGHQVFVIMCGETAKYSSDAQDALARAKSSGVQLGNIQILQTIRPEQWALVIDGLFGIGVSRAITGEIGTLIVQINQLKSIYHFPLLALDVPSGLNADNGQLVETDSATSAAILASHTITFIGDKPGLHTAVGKDVAGEIIVAHLDIDAQLFGVPDAYLNCEFLSKPFLHPRKQDSHKGSFGDVWIIGGANGMVGAAILSARSAIHSGAGRVFIGFLADQVPTYDSLHPELMCRHASELDYTNQQNTVVIIGPGMGNSAAAHQALIEALQHAPAIVIDADALNLIASDSALQDALKKRSQDQRISILTPHPLEAARLLSCTTHDVQADRLGTAQTLANQFNAVTILKGAGSIIATPQPDARTWINTTGNPALATAGTGDVLAGLCGALLAQRLSAKDAACIATWAHGLAADNLVAHGTGAIGLTASELLPAIRMSLNKLATDGLGANEVF